MNENKREFHLQMEKLSDEATAVAERVGNYFKPPNAMRLSGLRCGWDVIVCRAGTSDRIWGEIDSVDGEPEGNR